MERITGNENGRWLQFVRWEGERGLFQGVTVKSPEQGLGLDEEQVLELARDQGFSRVCRARQVHGSRVLSTEEKYWAGGAIPEGDGLIGAGGGELGLVTVADCVPVFLLEREAGAWGLVHAGWRGVEAGVLSTCLKTMLAGIRCAPDNLELYLGPSICGACYEIGPEVAQRLVRAVSAEGVRPEGKKYLADLRRLLAVQAAAGGVPSENIFTSAYCTRCHPGLFHSWRAEGPRALRRMWAFLGRRGRP